MEFITTLSIQLIVCAVLIQQSICGPPRYRRFRIPNPNAGVECPRAPKPGEYCDKFSSGQIKECKECSLDQLRNPDIAFPEECANLPCPWRCPEHISNSDKPASSDSCDLTTASLTTLDATTDAPTTYASTPRAPTSAPTPVALSTTTSSSQSTRPTDPPGNSAMPVSVIASIGTIIAVFAMAILAYKCIKCLKKRRCKWAVTTSPSSEPMMANNEIEMSPTQTPSETPPQTPTAPAPVIIPGQTSVEVTTQESDMFVKLGCNCGGVPIPVGPDGVTIPDLLPSTRYDIAIGTRNDDGFHLEYHVIETLQENPDVCRCKFSLHDLKNHIQSNSRDFQYLRASFGRITTRRALSRAAGATTLSDVDGQQLFEEIIHLDGQRRNEENSCSVYSILQALRADCQSVPVPEYVADICRMLSSIHEDCLPCRHLVCQVSRDSRETTV